MTALTSGEVWANGITVADVAASKVSTGFVCGDADPDDFNYALKRLGEAMITLQDDVSGIVSSVNTSIADFASTLTTLNQEVDSNRQDFVGHAEQANTATETRYAHVRLATATDVTTMASTDKDVVTAARMRDWRDAHGPLSLLFHKSHRWDVFAEAEPGVPTSGLQSTFTLSADTLRNPFVVVLRIPNSEGEVSIQHRLIMPVEVGLGADAVGAPVDVLNNRGYVGHFVRLTYDLYLRVYLVYPQADDDPSTALLICTLLQDSGTAFTGITATGDLRIHGIYRMGVLNDG